MIKTMASIDEIVKRNKELSSLPEIYIRVSELLDDEHSTAEQIGSVVQTDPALASRILKVVNSSFYGFPNEIATIPQAISILGRNPLRQLLIGTVLGGVFSRLSNSVFLMDDFWQHSVHTAVIAKHCYKNLVGKMKSDELFIAGLLHDIGRLIIAHQLPDEATQIQHLTDTTDTKIIDAELSILGFNHNEVGATVMKQWGLPSILQACTMYHENPQEAVEYKKEAWITFISSQLTQMPYTEDADEISEHLNTIPNWQESGLTEAQIIEAYQLSIDQFQMVLDSLGL